MKTLKTLGLFVLALALAMTALVGCGKTDQPKSTESGQTPAASGTGAHDADKAGKKRVALILEGAISDMSWNATAYQGLKKIEKLGAETKYVENVPASAVADAIRQFADAKYDVIFLSTNSYQDNGKKVAEQYPNVQFFFINSNVTMKNARSFSIQDAEQGFLMGALAAMLTETKTVGFIGGLPINPIINGGKGFKQGVAYIDKSIRVLSENTGNFDDVNRAKELAKAMIGDKADVLAPMANQASLGVMEAAEEMHKKAIGSGLNQETVAPHAAVVAILKDTSIAYEEAYKAYLKGNMPEKVLPMGAAQGVVSIGKYYNNVPNDVKEKLETIYKKLASGEIKINLD